MAEKRSTSFYLTIEVLKIIEEIAAEWGIPKNAVVEIAIRALARQDETIAEIIERLRRES